MRVAVVVGMACLVATRIASAEDPPLRSSEGGPESKKETRGGASLEEVTVTATRRAENVQDVAMSITVLDASQLEARDVKTFIDYAASVPNLGFGYTGNGFSNARSISIRGIAGNDTTGFYLDDTPLPESINPQIVDIDRIEVLRGPQGTLYGARSEGGTVRLITQQPDDTFSARTHLAISDTWNADRPNYTADAALNLPLVQDRLSLRVVGLYDAQAGFFKRQFPSTPFGTDYRTVDNVAENITSGGSVALRWKVNDNLTVTPRVLYQQSKYNGYPYSDHTAYEVPPPAEPPTSLNLNPNNFMQTRLYDIREGGSDKWSLSSLTMSYRTSFGDFISSSSYLDRKLFDTEDASDSGYQLLGAPFPWAIPGNTTLYEFVQEVRFVSDFSGPLQVITGVYYQSTRGKPFYQTPVIIDGLNEYFGGTPDNPAPGTNPASPDELIADSLNTRKTEPALYGEVTYQVADPLKVTVGARLYRVKVTSDAFSSGFATGGPVVIDPPVTLTQSGVNPKVELDYQLTSDKMVYALASKGFRPGGVTAALPAAYGCPEALAELGLNPQQVRAYKSDSVWNYEVGAKTSWLDQSLTVNAAAYYIDWSDIQQSVRLSCGASYTGNAGEAKSEGFELELNAVPFAGLQLNAGIGYTHATITAAGPTSPQRPGSRVYQVPDWTGSAGVTYTHALTPSVDLVSNVGYSYTGSSKSGNNNPDVPRVRDAYSLLDTRIAVAWDDYQIAFVGKNLTNEHANLSDNASVASEVIGRPRLVVNRPRTLGLEFIAKF